MYHCILLIQSYIQALRHLFYPHICLQCGTDELKEQQIICTNCEKQLPFTHFASMQNSPIDKIFWGRVSLKNTMSILFFTKESLVQKIIFELKYKHNKKAAYLLGKLIAYELLQNAQYKDIQYLVPIPISKRKLRKRGFNQSQLICEAIIDNGYAVPIFNGLKKINNSSSQTQKNRFQRGEQSNTLFELIEFNTLKDKHLLIVDDVLTTGATLEAACLCLLHSKPASIQIATAAYTLP